MPREERYDRRTPARTLSPGEIEEALAPFLRGRQVASATLLAGGFSNTNYRLDVAGGPLVLRATDRPPEALQLELDVMALARPHVPVPEVYHADLAHGLVVCLWMPGEPAADRPGLGREVGRILAAIHAVRLPGPGLLGPRCELAVPFEDFAGAIAGETRRCLAEAGRLGRLSATEANRAMAFLDRHAPLMATVQPVDRLVHADFNPKNLLVADGKVTAVLDWEFAFAGAPLMDLGNLLRFEHELPPGYRADLVAGYRAHGGELAPDWRLQARVLDLVNLAQFLASAEERPRTFATARAVLLATIGPS